MADKTLYIHIGTPKTGTTAIQTFLRENRHLMRKKGFTVYTAQDNRDRFNLRFLSAYLKTFGKPGLIRKGLLTENADVTKKILNKWYKKFIDDILNANTKNIIMSEEMLWWTICRNKNFLLFTDNLKNASFKIKIIVYLRRQDNYIMSMYQQALKAGGCNGMRCNEWIKSPDNLKTTAYTDYANILKNLAETFERKNIIVRAYEKRQLKNNSIFSDFMDALGIQLTGDFVIPQSNINQGLSPFGAELARFFSKTNKARGRFMDFISGCQMPSLFNKLGKQHDFLSPVDRIELMEKYEACNAYIAREFLGRNDGRLFYDPLPNAEMEWSQYELSPEDTASFLFDVIRRQMPEQNHKRYLGFLPKTLSGPLQYQLRKAWRAGRSVKERLLGVSK